MENKSAGDSMNQIINLIQQKFGDSCQFCSPLEETQYDYAKRILPIDLFEILTISNGIKELMTHPYANNGTLFVIDSIIYSFDEILSETETFSELFSIEGIVFAGNGAGGFYIIKPDETIYLYEFVGEEGEYCAENLKEYFSNYIF